MTSTAPAPEFTALVDRLGEASAQLAAYAEQQGVSRAETAAALAAEVVHAATVDPEFEARRAQFHADAAQFHADHGAYSLRSTEVRDQLFAIVDQVAALAGEAIAVTDEAAALEWRGQELAGRARTFGEPFQAPQVVESLVNQMRADPSACIPMMRLILASRRSREATISALADMAKTLNPVR